MFHPVARTELAELVPSLCSSKKAVQTVRWFAENMLRKTVIQSPDAAGFIVNRMLVPYLFSAIRLLEAGVASAEELDGSMVLACKHPIGPISLCDLIGLDALAATGDGLYSEYRDPSFVCPPIMRRLISANRLGRKTGSGFFDYVQATP